MKSLNQVLLTGYLGKDPNVVKVTEDGKFVHLSLATHRVCKEGQSFMQNTEWYNIVVNGKLGNFAVEVLKKGSRVCVQGKLCQKEWDDKKTGQKHCSIEIRATHLLPLEKKMESHDTKRSPF